MKNEEFAEKWATNFMSIAYINGKEVSAKDAILADLAEHDREILSQPIYAAEHNPCVHESAWGVIGLYPNQKAAEMAIEFMKHIRKEEGDEISVYEGYRVFKYLMNF